MPPRGGYRGAGMWLLDNEGALDPAARRNRLIDRRVALWRADPPAGPVILAGSTGSIPATRRLMRAVTDLPLGAVVLPGLDQGLAAETWERLDPGHPQYGLARVLEALNLAPDAVKVWPGAPPSKGASARAALLGVAMRPAGAPPSRPLPTDPPKDAETGLAIEDICRIDPEHVVCVPYDSNAEKMRCCVLEVVGFWNGRKMSDTTMDTDVVVTGYIVRIYEPPECPSGRTCPPPAPPPSRWRRATWPTPTCG